MRHWKPWIHIYMGSNWTAHEEPKKFVKSPCYVTIDISRAFPPKQTQVKICLQIQRELSGGQFSLSLYLKLFRPISNSSYNTTVSSRHRSVWKKKITEKKYRHLWKVWILSFLLLCRQAVFALITVKFSRAVVCHDQLFKIIFLCPLIAVAIFILSTKSQTGIFCKWENLFSTVHYKRFRVHGSYLS